MDYYYYYYYYCARRYWNTRYGELYIPRLCYWLEGWTLGYRILVGSYYRPSDYRRCRYYYRDLDTHSADRGLIL